MDIGLTAISESDIAKHLATAQSAGHALHRSTEAARESGTEIAGTRRRFVLDGLDAGVKSQTREVEFAKTLTLVDAERHACCRRSSTTCSIRTRRGARGRAGRGGALCAPDRP